LGNRQITHAGLDASEATGRVDFENLVEARHDQKDALLQRQRTARQPGSRASRHNRDTALVGDLQ